MARILVVDDEEGIRSFLAEALEMDGHTVSAAPDGAAALSVLARQGMDLMITDLKMPGMDGLSLLSRARQEQPELEAIVLTAYGSVESAVSAMKAGAFDYLTKPLSSPAELRLLVKRALERKTLLNIKATASQAGSVAVETVLSWGAPSMKPVVEALRKVAATHATVLLTGESGTGKEVAARALHEWSERADGPFVAVNCAALSETLLESELFGHERGAFTGAVSQRRGKLELAQGGTFFLDEVGELKAELQAKLLRVLQERSFERVGGTRTLAADVRWIAATNRDLGEMMAKGEFREDLYHRLAVFPIRMPPLRERPKDIRPLAELLLQRIAQDLKRPGLSLSSESLQHLESLPWPGNIRELRNMLERAAILSDGQSLELHHLWIDRSSQSANPELSTTSGMLPDVKFEELEKMAILQALDLEDGNRKRAAERLGIGVRTLFDKLRKYGEQEQEE